MEEDGPEKLGQSCLACPLSPSSLPDSIRSVTAQHTHTQSPMSCGRQSDHSLATTTRITTCLLHTGGWPLHAHSSGSPWPCCLSAAVTSYVATYTLLYTLQSPKTTLCQPVQLPGMGSGTEKKKWGEKSRLQRGLTDGVR